MEGRIAVLGSGDVGRSLATGCLAVGFEVSIAGRSGGSSGVQEWLECVRAEWKPEIAERCRGGAYSEVVGEADAIIVALPGSAALDILESVAAVIPQGIPVVDVSNPLAFPPGKPMELSIANTDSLGERIQALLPNNPVVKALNTVNSHIMTHPVDIPGNHVALIAGNDSAAKSFVSEILTAWRWPRIIDLGPIEAARGMESYMHLWLRLWSVVGHARFNIGVVEGPAPV